MNRIFSHADLFQNTESLELTLDRLAVGRAATITQVDWDTLAPDEAQRLCALGLDVGARVRIAHRGVLGGADPLAVSVGRMIVALRRVHAAAMRVVPDHDGARAIA